MKPYSWTPDGKSPHKSDGGQSGEETGMCYAKNKKLRKEAQRINQLENKRARQYYKNQTKKELEND